MKKVMKMVDVDEAVVQEKTVDRNYLPIETLPSNYKLYPEGTKILARPLNVLEVKLLASMDESNCNFVINDILKRTTKGINVEDLLIADKHFIIFWLRANTYKNSGYEVEFHCEKCAKDSKYNFNLDVLEIAYIKEGLSENEEKTLPISSDKVSFKFKRIKDENKVTALIKQTKNSITKYDDEIIDIAASLNKINGEELSLLNKYEFIEKMHPIDFSFVLSYMDLILFGVKEKINAICNNCKEPTLLGVTFRPEFFIPKYQF
jgi:T4 bacteriophage base plate protein